MGRRRTATATMLTLLLLAMFWGGGYAGRLANASAAQKKSSDKQTAQTKDLYSNHCARCHGADGRGQTAMGRAFAAPNLADAAWWKKTRPTDKRLTASLRQGRGHMPAFGQQLSKSEIGALARLARSFEGK